MRPAPVLFSRCLRLEVGVRCWAIDGAVVAGAGGVGLEVCGEKLLQTCAHHDRVVVGPQVVGGGLHVHEGRVLREVLAVRVTGRSQRHRDRFEGVEARGDGATLLGGHLDVRAHFRSDGELYQRAGSGSVTGQCLASPSA